MIFLVLLSLSLCNPVLSATRQQYVDKFLLEAEKYSKKEDTILLSIRYINNAIRIQPNNLGLYYKRAFYYGRAGCFKEAIKDYSYVIKRGKKKFPIAKRLRADCYAAVGEMGKALNDYKYMVMAYPHYGKYWYYYAELLWYVGLKKASLNAVQKGLSTTNPHWGKKMEELKRDILMGKRIKLHKPLSN